MANTGQNGCCSILLCGVGGQGLVMLSNIIGRACAASGIRAVTGEQHGLSQRSGTISIHLRVGQGAISPLIPIGSGDIILSLEAMESLRYIEYLKDGGIIISSGRIMSPISETAQRAKDPKKQYFGLEDVKKAVSRVTGHLFYFDALALAKESGNPLAENIAVLGALSALAEFPLEPDALKNAIRETVPAKALEANLKAFDLGAGAAREQLCKEIKCR